MEKINVYITGLLLLVAVCTSYATPQDSYVEDIHKKCYKLIRSKDFEKVNTLAKDLIGSGRALSNEELSETYYIIGYVSRQLNLFSEAINYYEKAIEKTGDPDKKGKIYNNIAGVLHYVSLHDEAIKECEKSIKISKKWTPVGHYNQALSQIALSDYVAAAESLDAGLQVCDELGKLSYKAKLWNQHGIINKNLYEDSRKEEYAELASRYFGYVLEAQKNNTEIARAYHYLAELRLLEGDTVRSIELFNQSIALQENKQYRFHTIRDLTELYTKVGYVEEAKTWCDSALALFPSVTLTHETLMIFFAAQDLGHIIPRDPFQEFFDEKEQAEKTYTAYIGRQLIREQELLIREYKIAIIIISVALSVVLYFLIKWLIRIHKMRKLLRIEFKKGM